MAPRTVRLPAGSRRAWFLLIAGSILAIAIGTNVAVWAAAYSAFLAPLPYPHGARLVSVV